MQADKKSKINEKSILDNLKELGVVEGDTLLITADLLKTNFVRRNRRELQRIWLNILKEAVGPEGTIVVVSFTQSFLRFAKNPQIKFHRTATTTSGALSCAMLADQYVLRSTHPTNSILAWGKNASYMTKAHTPTEKSYSYVAQLIALDAKHLMLGTLDRKNAPVGFHYAQELLGETATTPGVGLLQTYYVDGDGATKLFTRWDGGGCSGAGYKLIGHHILNEAIQFGNVGDAPSALINVQKSVKTCLDALIVQRKHLICDDEMCLSCRGRWKTSGIYVLIFYIKYTIRFGKRVYQKIMNAKKLVVNSNETDR